MSGLGILASALGGGASAIEQQAKGDIAQQREGDLATQKANIEEQMRMRLADYSEKIRQQQVIADNTGPGAEARLGFLGRSGEVSSKTEIDKARGLIPVTQAAAMASAKTADDITMSRAANPTLLAAGAKIELASPTVAAKIAEMRSATTAHLAAAGASGAHSKMLAAETERVNLSNDDTKTLVGIYGDMDKTLVDKSIDDAERATRLAAMEKRAVLIQRRSGKYAGQPRDPELDTTTTETTKMLPDGTQVKSTAKTTRRPGQDDGAADQAKGPAVGTEKDGFVFNGGNPNDKNNWSAKPSKPAKASAQPVQDDMTGISFVGDGYSFNGKTYPTPTAAKEARDRATLSNNPMSRSISKYGDD